MSSSGVTSTSHLDSTYGCVFLATIFTTALWGVGCVQIYLYYAQYWKTDMLWFKIYIFLIWIFVIAQEAVVVGFSYTYFVKGIADPSLLTSLPRTLINNALLTGFIDALVQGIFVRRAWYISNRNSVLVAILSCVVLAQLAVTIAYYGQIYNFDLLMQLTKVRRMEIALNCTVVFADSFLAIVLIWLLWRSRSGFKRTDSIIKRLITYAVGSGLVTALWAAMALIGAEAAPQTLFYLFSDMAYPQLYFNSMLTSLIIRSRLHTSQTGEMDGANIALTNLSSISTGRSIISSDPANKAQLPRTIECRVDIDIETGVEK